MTGWTAGRTLPDARYFQIAALGSLLAINFAWIDFGAGRCRARSRLAQPCSPS